MTFVSRLSVGVLVLLTAAACSFAQADGVPIETRSKGNDASLNAKMTAVHEADEALRIDEMREALAKPTPAKINLPAPATAALSPVELYKRARQSTLRVGWTYLCKHCNNWHTNLAGGYVVTEDGLAATCYHVLAATPPDAREAVAVATDLDGNVYPITQIVAADQKMDAAIVRLGGAEHLKPMALNDQTAPGQSVYLLSDPNGTPGYFSAGMINRFYWMAGKTEGDATNLDDAKSLRVNFSTDWSPGSSGAAIVDTCGNMVGHVATIEAVDLQPDRQSRPTTGPATGPQRQPNGGTRGTVIVFHEGIPARAVKLLAEAATKAAEPNK